MNIIREGDTAGARSGARMRTASTRDAAIMRETSSFFGSPYGTPNGGLTLIGSFCENRGHPDSRIFFLGPAIVLLLLASEYLCRREKERADG